MSRGHRLPDLLQEYTLDQVQAFVRAAHANRQMELYEEAIIMRAAAQAMPKDFDRLLQRLKAGMLEEREPKPVTKSNVRVLKMFFGGKYREAAKAIDRGKE